jgi:hypothetical protein
MTAFTPDIKIFTLPPNSSHDPFIPRTEIVDLVDYSFSINKGSSDYITAPYPGQTEVSLLFDQNVIPDIELGTWMEISLPSGGPFDYSPIYSGFVINRTSSYRAYGLSGFVLEWNFTLASGISILQNTTWYLDADFTGTTTQCLEKVYENIGKLRWDQVNSNFDWTEIGPETWEDFDAARIAGFPLFTITSETTEQKLTAGLRNVWNDIITLVYGVYGIVYENNRSNLITRFVGGSFVNPILTLDQQVLGTDILASDSFDKLRNEITITKADGTALTYYDDNSINLYQERAGSLDTYITQTLDAADVGQRILNNLAFPTLSTDQISVNLLNPNLTDAVRSLLAAGAWAQRWRIIAPEPMGSTQIYIPVGSNIQIDKNSFIVSLNLVLLSTIDNSKNWAQIGYNYTWTSYGVAFPTQEWIDL